MKPLAIDLYSGLGGWTEGLLAEGYQCIGFDIERHEYGDERYPAQLVIQDVLTLHSLCAQRVDRADVSPANISRVRRPSTKRIVCPNA